MAEWPLETSLGQATDAIEDSVFDPNGTWVAYVSRDGNCYIHTAGGSWGHDTTINVGSSTVGLDVSPDGAWIATTDNDGVCEVWETETWTSVTSFTDCGTNYPRGVAFSRDNAYLAYALNETSGYGARVVNTSDWSEAALLTDATMLSRGIGWSDSYVAVASRDTDVYVYDLADWSLAQTVTYPTDLVEESDFSQDGAYLVVTGYDQTVRIIDTSDWSEDHTISVGYNSVTASFGYHDNWLAYGNHNGEAIIHEHDSANNWPQDSILTEPVDRVYSVAFSQDEQWFTAGEEGTPFELHVYDAPATTATVSGTFVYNGTGTSGATVRGINDTQGTHQGIDTTDANGDYAIEFPTGDEGHFMIEFTDPDTGDPVKAESKPFIVTQ